MKKNKKVIWIIIASLIAFSGAYVYFMNKSKSKKDDKK